MRFMMMVLTTLALALAGPAPAAPPEAPLVFISVDSLKSLRDSGATVDLIDVRTRGEYDELHVQGARSLPLREVEWRSEEVPRTGHVVLY